MTDTRQYHFNTHRLANIFYIECSAYESITVTVPEKRELASVWEISVTGDPIVLDMLKLYEKGLNNGYSQAIGQISDLVGQLRNSGEATT